MHARAGFDFDRRDAFGEQRLEPRGGLAEQGVFVCGTCRADRGDDAAAPPRDLFVADSRQTLRESAGALAAVHQMRMTIDETGAHPRAVQILARPCGVFSGQGSGSTEPGDCAVLHGDRSIGQRVFGIALWAKFQVMPDGLLHCVLFAARCVV
jgi:hypothetical protein